MPDGVSRRGDPQPTTPCRVLLASSGQPFSQSAVRRAVELADGAPVGVLTIARIHGTSLGIPHPGLMPTKRELQAQLDLVEDAIRQLRRSKLEADGQVAATRRTARTIARVARARQAGHVVMDAPTGSQARRLVEGDPSRGVRRRLRGTAAVEVVPAGPDLSR